MRAATGAGTRSSTGSPRRRRARSSVDATGRAGIAKPPVQAAREPPAPVRGDRAHTPVGWPPPRRTASSTPFGSCQERNEENSSAPITKTTSPYRSPRPASGLDRVRRAGAVAARSGTPRRPRAPRRRLRSAGSATPRRSRPACGAALRSRRPRGARAGSGRLPPRRARGGRCGAGRPPPRRPVVTRPPTRATRPRS